MKASNPSEQHVKVARDARQSQLLRTASEGVLKQLGLTKNDSRQIDHKIQEYLNQAKVLGSKLEVNPADELRHQFLAVATAAFLLAFDTEPRKRKLKQICVREGAAGQSNTPLLLCVLLAYGYNKQDRRRASEDGIAVEYALSRGALPSDFVKFFSTRGQSLSTCYRIAKRPDRKLGRKQPTKISLTLPPKRSERWQQLSLGRITITMIQKKTPVDGVLVDLIISPAMVKTIRELIKEALKTARNQVEAITTHDIPLRSYVGIDAYKEMIEFLTQHVNDDRLSFHHLNARNPKYNKSGDPLTPETILPIGDKRFDVICMFSVITHQLPHDAQAIFAILRRYVKESGFLFFSASLAEGDFGYREHDPEKPTELSVYSKDLLSELLEREKWRVVSIEPESPRDLPILDSILCAPA